MSRQVASLARWRAVFFAFSISVFLGLGCGGGEKPSPNDPTANGDDGRCDVEDSSSCDAGYACVEGACVVEEGCSEADACTRGECIDGVCQNGSTCESDTACLDGFVCSEGDCVEDLCSDVDCARGVCDRTTGECANDAVCTQDTEATDCLEGYFCYGQVCVDEATLCGELDCSRGVCDVDSRSCIDAADCAGDDLLCLEGRYCDPDGACQENLCDSNSVSCDRGVCDPTVGECVNKEPCAAATECLDGVYCITDTCIDAAEACAACTGNQTCNYDGSALAVVCEESADGCVNGHDCVGERVCVDGACSEPEACAADAYEPNEQASEATDYLAVSPTNASISASLCSGDSDIYTYDVAADADFTGVLIVDLAYVPADVGNGDLTVRLLGPDSTEIATGSAGATGTVTLEHTVGVVDQGVYTIEVLDAGDVGTAGVDYMLYADLVDQTVVTACQNAEVLVSAMTASGDTTTGSTTGLGTSCLADSSSADVVYSIELAEESYVSVTVTPTDISYDPAVGLRTRCATDDSEFTCADDNLASGSESVSGLLSAGTYYVTVQGSNTGAYDLYYSALPVICTEADNTCTSADTAQYCNATRTALIDETCSNGCDMTLGLCSRLASDVCYTAIDASAGITDGVVPFSTLANDYDPGPTTCLSAPADGPEAVYMVDVPAGHVVEASLYAPFEEVILYAVSDCSDVTANCLIGSDSATWDETEFLTWTNDQMAAQTIYVMADVVFPGSLNIADGIIDLTVRPVICTPGDVQCNVDDLETCNTAGTAWDTETCLFGCDPTLNACNPPANDQCAGALDASMGGVFSAEISEYVDDYDPGSSGCTGFRASGPDAVFFVSGQVGTIVDVELATPYDGSLWAVTDCANAAATCLAGDDGSSPETIQFVLTSTDPHYIFADSYASTPTGTFDLTVTTRIPDCNNVGEAIACVSTDTLQWCNSLGLYEDYTCATTCTGAACDSPSGDTCFDASVITPGSISGSFGSVTDQLNPGVNGCLPPQSSGVTAEGSDVVYAIDLVAGSLLDASLIASDSSALYVIDSCADFGPGCAVGEGFSNNPSLTFFAPVTGRYYLVVDGRYSWSSDPFTLQVDVRAGGVCQPGASCDPTSGNLTVCADDGLSLTGTIQCPYGCSGTSCNVQATPNDTCVDAVPIAGPYNVWDSYSRFTDQYNPGTSSTCITEDADGPDSVYRISLNTDEVVLATVTSVQSWDSPMVYFLTDCSDPTNSCVSGTDSSTSTVVGGYHATTAGDVYLVVDSSSSFADDTFQLEIDIQNAECTPGTQSCKDASTRQTCSSFALYEEEYCYFGCLAGVCQPPTNDACSGAVDATGGGSFGGQIDLYTDDYDPTNADSCTGFGSPGADAVYVIQAVAGDIIDVIYTTDFDGSVYATDGCSGFGTACLAGSDSAGSNGTETLRFAASQTGPIYIYADAYSSAPTGAFTLDIQHNPPICQSGAAQCAADGITLEYCDSLGSAYLQFACRPGTGGTPGACLGTECEFPSGEICPDAIAGLPGTYSLDMSGLNNDYTLSSGACGLSGSASGQEAVFRLDLVPNQVLDVTVTPAATEDAILYLKSACNGNANSCLTGADTGFSGDAETFRYLATQVETLYLFVDGWSSTAVGTWDVDIAITNAQCTPGDVQCNMDGVTLEYCDAFGSWVPFACHGTCTGTGGCDTPSGDICPDVIAASPGSYTVDMTGLTDTSSMGFSSCVGEPASGNDAIFKVDLLLDDVLTVDVTPGAVDDPVVYLAETCENLAGTCQGAAVSGASGAAEQLKFRSDKVQTVYVVADSTMTQTETWQVDFAVVQAQCNSGQQQCSSGTDLDYCDRYGTFVTYPCNGTCSGTTCDTPTGEICPDAIDVTMSGQITGDFTGVAADYSPSTTACTNWSANGPDLAYRVVLAQGQTVAATLSGTGDTSLYIVSDCGDIDGTCLDGDDSFGVPESVSYTSANGEVVYIIADNYDTGASAAGPFTLDITIQ